MDGSINITLIYLHFNTALRVLQKNLSDLGYYVNEVSSNFEVEIEEHLGETVLFIVCLPENAYEEDNARNLSKIFWKFARRTANIMVIGESAIHNAVMSKYPNLHYFPWFDKPLDASSLSGAVKRAIINCEKQRGKKRILLVDDDPTYAKMVKEWLKDRYKVEIVTAGMQAITFLLKMPPDKQVDLILLDYEMPIVDGPQVLQMLRQEKATKDIPVIFLTGVDSKEGVTRVMSLRPEGYLLKSAGKEDIRRYLRKEFGER
ncbi:MAG: response regulator [Lachnospiraceae bacterium]|jgi:CheY-like chemotaxis protein|nr:response regulator [Lachnospiraceae bacterium]